MKLSNYDLFKVDEEEYEDYDLDFNNESDTIGIMSKRVESRKIYYVYRTIDMSEMHFTCDIIPIMWEKEFYSFHEAINEARRCFKGLVIYEKIINKDNSLTNEELFMVNEYNGELYEFVNIPNVIGLSAKDRFVIYQTNERGYVDWTEEFDDFNEAIIFARKMYKGMLKSYNKKLYLN